MDTETLIDKYAKALWNFLKLNQEIEPADCILVFCSNELRVARKAAELYFDGYAPIIVFSGKSHTAEPVRWNQIAQAELFAQVAINLGVPKDKIIKEPRAINPEQNIKYSLHILHQTGQRINKVIIVEKPYMERRTFATVKNYFPTLEFTITSPNFAFEDSATEDLTKEDIINLLVGYTQRIIEYPKLGYQVYQEVPQEVWNAYNKLIKLGFRERLI